MAGECAARRTDPLSAKLKVKLTPAGGADRIDRRALDANGEAYLKARVRAAPEKGEANAALEALLANALGAAKAKVKVARGISARMKIVEVEGASAAELAKFVGHYAEKP